MLRRPSPPPLQKKPLSLKLNDEEPLSRTDLQYDVLHSIFTDPNCVFTDPHESLHGHPAGTKVNFRDLYVNSIIHAPKASKLLREKMLDVPQFGTDFAMISLLVNIGRIPNSMAFFPEMKSTLRTYHPIPALQTTNGNLQDAPRIRQILKSCLLAGEAKGAPTTPNDILARSKAGHIPPTSITNLVFVMASHATTIAHTHFPSSFDFFDLFLPNPVSSSSRARAFLWLCYHYLEAPSSDDDDDYDGGGSVNPFTDPNRNAGKMPDLVNLTPEEYQLENVEPEAEKLLTVKLITHRNQCKKAQVEKAAPTTVGEDDEGNGADIKGKAKRAAVVAKPAITAKEKKAAADKLRRERIKEKAKESKMIAPAHVHDTMDDDPDMHPPEVYLRTAPQNQYPQPQHDYQLPPQPIPLPPYRRVSSYTPEPPNLRPQRYSPYKLSPVSGLQDTRHKTYPRSRLASHSSRAPKRTMMQHAWHVVMNTDPLLDSDEEFADEHVRNDYAQRLQIMTRLRGREPTPEPVAEAVDMSMDVTSRRNTSWAPRP